MKIALGIYGHFKNFNKTKESICSLKSQFNADVFVSSYKTKSYSTDKYIFDRDKQIIESDFDILSPKIVVLEDNIFIENFFKNKIEAFTTVFKLTPVKEISSQIISIRNRLNILNLIDEKYDFIILIRPDTLILKPIKFDFKKLNIIKLLDLYQDSLIAGPSYILRNLIEKINSNFGIAIDCGNIITCPHKVLEFYSNKYPTSIIKDAWVTLLPKDRDTVETRKSEFSKLFVSTNPHNTHQVNLY